MTEAKTGDVATSIVLPSCGPPTMDARAAAAAAIAAYLFGLEFRKWNGDVLTGQVSTFQLRAIRREWPEPNEKLLYPCASIIDYGDVVFDAANFTPVCLEESRDVYGPGTILWKLDELQADFQIDFWTDDAATREAIAAALPGAFAPGEETGVILVGPDRYFRETCRATLISHRRDDDSASAYVRERRLRAIVRVQIGVLDLRRAAQASYAATVSEIGPVVEIRPDPSIAPNAADGC